MSSECQGLTNLPLPPGHGSSPLLNSKAEPNNMVTPSMPDASPTQAAPKYLAAHLRASPTCYLVRPWHLGTTSLPA